ncbi:MAG: cell wall hydrolase [Vallitaleaceae bacterium]|nr:cell wall hydrolase [Vallitaleaceae bacterium]
MKRLLMLLMTCFLMVQACTVTSAEVTEIPITIVFNGQFVPTTAQSYTQNKIVYVPLRVFIDALAIDNLQWIKEENSAIFEYQNKTIQFFMNQNRVIVNGHEYETEALPKLQDGVAMVPLDFLATNLGCTLKWNQQLQFVYITKADVTVKRNNTGYTPEDVLWLARIVQVEASDTSYECKLAIANVVLNRVKSGIFPGTVHDVIFQAGRFPQFPPAHKESFSVLSPARSNILVAKRALNGENNISKCLYFNNRPFSSKSDDLYSTIDGEYFYY